MSDLMKRIKLNLTPTQYKVLLKLLETLEDVQSGESCNDVFKDDAFNDLSEEEKKEAAKITKGEWNFTATSYLLTLARRASVTKRKKT